MITDEKVIHIEGVLQRRIASTPLAKVSEFTVRQPLLGRVFDYGQLVVDVPGGRDQALHGLDFLPDPAGMYRLVSDTARFERVAEGVARCIRTRARTSCRRRPTVGSPRCGVKAPITPSGSRASEPTGRAAPIAWWRTWMTIDAGSLGRTAALVLGTAAAVGFADRATKYAVDQHVPRTTTAPPGVGITNVRDETPRGFYGESSTVGVLAPIALAGVVGTAATFGVAQLVPAHTFARPALLIGLGAAAGGILSNALDRRDDGQVAGIVHLGDASGNGADIATWGGLTLAGVGAIAAIVAAPLAAIGPGRISRPAPGRRERAASASVWQM